MAAFPTFGQPAGGVVCDKENIYICTLGPRESHMYYKLFDFEGNELDSGEMARRPIDLDGAGNFIYYRTIPIDTLSVRPKADDGIMVGIYFNNSDSAPLAVLHCGIFYPSIRKEFSDSPALSTDTLLVTSTITGTSWLGSSTFGLSALNTKLTDLDNRVKTLYIGNKKLVMYYCTAVPETNPRKLFLGCEDYVIEYIKNDTDANWDTPISEKTLYYWYNDDEKLYLVGDAGA